jgi:Ca-activated chloride channel family protein
MLSRIVPVLFLALMFVPSYAADPAEFFTMRKQVGEARITFSVQDGRGGSVSGLTRDDVRVINDGHQVSEITSFYAYENVPIRLVILLDASDSMSRRFGDERQMAESLLNSVIRPGSDEATVITFASKARSVATVNRIDFRSLKADGPTALYDSIFNAIPQMNAVSARPVRRILILFSDGEDNWSEHSLEDAIAAAQEADITIYPITAHSHRYVYVGDKILRQLAESTGGHAFFLTNFDKPQLVYNAIQAELRAHYVVGFRPSTDSAQAGFHTLKISARNPKLKVRTRSGYYVEPVINP